MSQARVDELRAVWERSMERDRPADALEALAELEQVDPREPLWSHRLGDAFRRTGHAKDAAQAFERAMGRYQATGFLLRAIAMAKLAESLDPSRAGLLARLSPEPAAARRDPPPLPLNPVPLARAKDEREDEVRFDDSTERSSIELALEDVEDLDLVMDDEPPTRPGTEALPEAHEPSIDRLAVMVGFRLFAGLSREALLALSSAAELIEFVPGAIVIQRDEMAFALYAIVGGTARVEVRGSPAIRLGEGEVFGEGCLLDEGRRQADVRAETRLSTLRIGKTAVDAIVAEHTDVKDALFQILARRLVANVVVTSGLFKVFEPKVRLELAQMFEARLAPVGTTIAERGRRTDALYVLLAGDLTATNAAGEDTHVARGTTFGHASLLGGGASDVTVRATTEAVLLRLPAAKFTSLAALYPPALAHLSETADEPLRASLYGDEPT